MNNESIKEMLLSLSECSLDFSVCMTGKESKTVNGLYKPDTHEILLHNKNFKNDNLLIYTAIHEYTHHLICCKNGSTSNGKVHTTEFWVLMDELLEKAVEKKIYKRERSEKLTNLINNARQIDCEITQLKKKLGKILSEIQKESTEEEVRFEDVLTHDIGLKQSTAKKCMAAEICVPDDVSCGQDKMDVFIKAVKKDSSVKEKLKKAVSENKSAEQLNAIVSASPKNESQYDKLVKEKGRLEKTLKCLNQRYEVVCELIASS